MVKRIIILFYVTALCLCLPVCGHAESFLSGSSGGVMELGSGGGWEPVALGMAAMESSSASADTSSDSSGTSSETIAAGTSAASSWENFGWEPQDDGSWRRTSDTPIATVTTQTQDWWENSLVDSYSTPFTEQGTPVTTLTNQWTVNSKPVSTSITTTGVTEAGQTKTLTVDTTSWDTTTYGNYDTITAERWDGRIDTEVWNYKHFGEFETTGIYSVEVLTPYGDSGNVIATGTGETPATVETGTGKSGRTVIRIPEDADSPDDAGSGSSAAEHREELSAEAGEGTDVETHMEEILPDGQRGMTVGPDGNPIPLEDLSDAYAGTSVDFEQRMAEAASASWPPAVQLSGGKPATVSTTGYTLTQEEDRQVTSTDTEMLEEKTEEKSEKIYEEYTPEYVSDSTVEEISVEHKTSVTEKEKTEGLVEQWTQKELIRTYTETAETGGDVTNEVKTWTEESDPVKERTTTIETNPDNPLQVRTVTTITSTKDVTTYEQDITKVGEKTERAIEIREYNVKEYGKYRTDETVTVDGETETLKPVFETVLLGETAVNEQTVIAEEVTPGYEEAGEIRIISVEPVTDTRIEYGEWQEAETPTPPTPPSSERSESSSGSSSSGSGSNGPVEMTATNTETGEKFTTRTGLKSEESLAKEASQWSLPDGDYDFSYRNAGETGSTDITDKVDATKQGSGGSDGSSGGSGGSSSSGSSGSGNSGSGSGTDSSGSGSSLSNSQKKALKEGGFKDSKTGKVYSRDKTEVH